MDLYIFVFIAAVFIGIVLDRWYTWMRAQQHGMRMKVVMGVPTTIILDRQGREIARLVGAAAWDTPDAIAAVRNLLPRPPAGAETTET